LNRIALSQAERQLILLSAGTADRRRAMREHAEGLMAEVDWPRLAETLRLRRLLPALGPRILDLAEGQASDGFAAAVEQAMGTTRRQALFLQLVSLHVMTALAEAEIRCTPLKGPFLGEAIYGDPGRRLSNDVDLLVAPEQLHQAVEVLLRLGYKAPTDHVDHSGLPQLHFLLVHEEQKLPPVELHWRVHWYERSFARERLLPPAGDPGGEWRPAPADELVALLLFYARDGFVDLRLATDLSAWWDVFGAKLQLGALDDLLRAYPALARVIPAAIEVAEKVVGLPAAQVVEEMPKLGLRGRTAVRLADPNPHTSRAQLYADMGFIDGLLMPPGDFGAFIRRQVLLPREVLDEYALRAPEWRAKSSLDYGLRVLARYGLAMVRTVRAPETLR
jgi:Uncharacterised nucleotidyltransferase